MIMAFNVLIILSAIAAAVPVVFSIWNMRLLKYSSGPVATDPVNDKLPTVSILIPARNEAHRIGAALESIAAQSNSILETIVLDDGSSDGTKSVIQGFEKSIHGLRVVDGQELPAGWCGKNFACWQLANQARGDLLVYLDADVQLKPGAIAFLQNFALNNPQTDLASGIPLQIMGTFWESILIPQIHFVLLGFLPMAAMRRTLDPGFAAACGQLLIVRRDAYFETGGHSAIASRIHDGLQLARHFRKSGFATDLFDATPLASCRMYDNARDVFHGLAKNATEGMADWKAIFPMSYLLIFGQVLPVFLLGWACLAPSGFSPAHKLSAALVTLLAFFPRIFISRRFHLGLPAGFLQPLSAATLIGIQWYARLKALFSKSTSWKGRSYPVS